MIGRYQHLVVVVFFFVLFNSFFTYTNLSFGDWQYLYPEAADYLSPFSLWGYGFSGLGSSKLPIFWLEGYYGTTIKFAGFMPWFLYERLFWFWPFLGFSALSSYFLSKKIIKDNIFALLSSLIYTSNTYILMVVSGGQMGVALAYSIAPITLYCFIRLLLNRQYTFRSSFFAGLVFSFLAMLDIRLSYILAVIIVLFYFYYFALRIGWGSIIKWKNIIYYFLIPLNVALLFHLYWILPLLFYNLNPISQLGEEYTSTEILNFFSFAKLENTISLLHPNWPDNTFGKVHFLKPQYLILPILAFASLFLIRVKGQSILLFFVLVALLGIFLAKGTNEPFGEVYTFLYEYVPGFKMFRDPTKWYLLIALSYSILIPFALLNGLGAFRSYTPKVFNFLRKNLFFFNLRRLIPWRVSAKSLVFILFVLIWVILCYHAVLDRKGTLSGRSFPPEEYHKLKEMIANNHEFFRTLWIPRFQTFGYSSEKHPFINFKELGPENDYLKLFSDGKSIEVLRNFSIRYVIFPINRESEIFVTDGNYDKNRGDELIRTLNSFEDLRRVNEFKELVVYEVSGIKPHIYLTNGDKVDVKRVSSTNYLVSFNSYSKNNKLVFVENYDKNWVFKNKSGAIPSQRFKGGVNSFDLGEFDGPGGSIVYKPQKLVYLGLVGTASVLIIAVYLIFRKK